MPMLPRHAILLSAAFLLGGCEVVTELGKPCVLVRKATEAEQKEGKRAVDVTQGELADGAGQDFISFGALGCEEQICVRDYTLQKPTLAQFLPKDTPTPTPDQVKKAEADLAAELSKPALGYCSRPCVEDSSSCEVTNAEADASVRERMTCRRMLLDDEALNRLKASDPDYYRRTFGNYENASFCAGELKAAPAQQN